MYSMYGTHTVLQVQNLFKLYGDIIETIKYHITLRLLQICAGHAHTYTYMTEKKKSVFDQAPNFLCQKVQKMH